MSNFCYSSFAKVRSRCELHMVADHLGFLHGECESMVQGERCRDLQNMYPLLRSVSGGVQVLVLHVMDHIKQQGLEAVTGLRGENVIFLVLFCLLSECCYLTSSGRWK